jgi:hypothetical protein
MKKRLESLEKIERVQKQMHDLAVWRLAALGRDREALVEDHRQMLAAIDNGLLAYGAPAAAAFRRIRALEMKIAAAEAELAAQRRRTVAHGTRAKLADRARESVEAAYRDQQQRKELAELIDASLNHPKSSPA